MCHRTRQEYDICAGWYGMVCCGMYGMMGFSDVMCDAYDDGLELWRRIVMYER